MIGWDVIYVSKERWWARRNRECIHRNDISLNSESALWTKYVTKMAHVTMRLAKNIPPIEQQKSKTLLEIREDIQRNTPHRYVGCQRKLQPIATDAIYRYGYMRKQEQIRGDVIVDDYVLTPPIQFT